VLNSEDTVPPHAWELITLTGVFHTHRILVQVKPLTNNRRSERGIDQHHKEKKRSQENRSEKEKQQMMRIYQHHMARKERDAGRRSTTDIQEMETGGE
jgi:hypothetical protein